MTCIIKTELFNAEINYIYAFFFFTILKLKCIRYKLSCGIRFSVINAESKNRIASRKRLRTEIIYLEFRIFFKVILRSCVFFFIRVLKDVSEQKNYNIITYDSYAPFELLFLSVILKKQRKIFLNIKSR